MTRELTYSAWQNLRRLAEWQYRMARYLRGWTPPDPRDAELRDCAVELEYRAGVARNWLRREREKKRVAAVVKAKREAWDRGMVA